MQQHFSDISKIDAALQENAETCRLRKIGVRPIARVTTGPHQKISTLKLGYQKVKSSLK